MRLQFLLAVPVSLSASLVSAVSQVPAAAVTGVSPLFAALVYDPARINTTRTRSLTRRDGTISPAQACGAAAPSPCESMKSACCEESTQCRPVEGRVKGQEPVTWQCLVRNVVQSAMGCTASDTPCSDGETCCPEGMSCGAEGGCMPEIGLDADSAACDDGESACADACCTEKEACNLDTGVCMDKSTVPELTTASSSSSSGTASTTARVVTVVISNTVSATPGLANVTAVSVPNAAAENGQGALGLAFTVVAVTFIAALA